MHNKQMDGSMSEAEPISSELSGLQYGSYRVLHPLGSGGMSSVYRAIHEETGHEVALKVLPVGLAKNPIVLQRFLREARARSRSNILTLSRSTIVESIGAVITWCSSTFTAATSTTMFSFEARSAWWRRSM